ncbi:MAG: OmpH family outer membrane protein [Chlorobi bacterium]|nr:OmpH family outer membrane protein [Chlorobiota bacterium]
MKNRIGFLSVLLIIGTVLYAQQQPMKFGNVNTQEILTSMPELKQVQTKLEEEYNQKEKQLTALQEELKNKQEAYMKVAESMTPEARAAKEQELQQMGQKIQNFYMLAQQQLKAKEQELKAPILEKVKIAIQEVGDENGFLYIFEITSGMPVYHSDKTIDVTPLVKKKLGIPDTTTQSN